MLNQPEIFFDLETQRLAEEVGGWNFKNRMGLSCAVTLNGMTQEFQNYLEADIAHLLVTLQSAGRVIGFNLKSFDYVVLQPYTKVKLSRLPTLDLLEEIYRTLGFRLSLDALAAATLDVSKFADGVQAVRWYKAGELQKLLEYCRQDVLLTQRLYLFGKEHGFLWYRDREQRKQRVEVSW
ncbi:ribonuclease H-like domain-containing protein [candidate division KSB1 bacterium]|nr:ribonuclease H-like domain-containing protein [candidate division KSB1 bacterium]